MVTEIETGMPVILDDATLMEAYGLTDGMEGMANAVINIDGADLIYFMPDGTAKVFVIDAERLRIDHDKIAKVGEGSI